MAKRRKGSEEGISLFPFLSILACVIGVLTLMITGLSLGQMDRPEGKKAERAEMYQKLENEIADKKGAVDKLQAFLAHAETIRDAKEELQRLKGKKKKAIVDKEQTIKLLAEANRLKKRIEELTPDTASLQERIAKLNTELERRKKPPEEARLIVQPGGSGVNLVPSFVECTQTGIVILDGKEPQRIRRSDLAKSPEFLELLNRVADQESQTIVFLIRDDAIGTYSAARNIARSHYCRNGKLPLIGHGRIDLSMFAKKFNKASRFSQ